MIGRVLRAWRERHLRRELDRRLAERKVAGKARSEAAQRGQETELRRRIARHKALWGQG